MARYIHAILEDFSDLIPFLPEDKRTRVLQLQGDGLVGAKQQISTSKCVLESLAQILSSAVLLFLVACHNAAS